MLRRSLQGGDAFALPASVDQLAGNVAGDFKGFRNRAPLRHQPGQLFGRGKENALRKLLYLYVDPQFHTN